MYFTGLFFFHFAFVKTISIVFNRKSNLMSFVYKINENAGRIGIFEYIIQRFLCYTIQY